MACKGLPVFMRVLVGRICRPLVARAGLGRGRSMVSSATSVVLPTHSRAASKPRYCAVTCDSPACAGSASRGTTAAQ